MTTLNISINTDNSAFESENLGSEISRILKSYANAIESVVDPDTSWELETRLAVFQHEMLHSFELVFRYYKTKKKGFK